MLPPRLAELRTLYTDEHFQVRSLRQQVAAAEQRKEELEVAYPSLAGLSPSPSPGDVPAQSIRVAALAARVKELTGQLERVQRTMRPGLWMLSRPSPSCSAKRRLKKTVIASIPRVSNSLHRRTLWGWQDHQHQRGANALTAGARSKGRVKTRGNSFFVWMLWWVWFGVHLSTHP